MKIILNTIAEPRDLMNETGTDKTDSRLNKTLSWTYDNVGNLKTKTDYQGNVSTYQYDSTNRLVAMRNPAYTYDARYQLISVNSTLNSEDRSYTYDAVDNRKSLLDNGIAYYYNHSTGNRLTDIRTTSFTGPVYRQFS